MLVSAETGVMYAWGDDKKENPIECMLVKTEGDSEEWQPLGFNSIEGFTYIKGHEYYLSVKRTILAIHLRMVPTVRIRLSVFSKTDL